MRVRIGIVLLALTVAVVALAVVGRPSHAPTTPPRAETAGSRSSIVTAGAGAATLAAEEAEAVAACWACVGAAAMAAVKLRARVAALLRVLSCMGLSAVKGSGRG